jgi:hypothetical protein
MVMNYRRMCALLWKQELHPKLNKRHLRKRRNLVSLMLRRTITHHSQRPLLFVCLGVCDAIESKAAPKEKKVAKRTKKAEDKDVAINIQRDADGGVIFPIVVNDGFQVTTQTRLTNHTYEARCSMNMV